MMIRYKIILLLVVAISLSFSGCKKFLELKSDSRLVVPQTLSDVQGLLDDANLMNINTTPSFGEVSADDYFLTPARINVQPTLQKSVYSWKYFAYNHPNDWSRAYSVVYNTNLCLELLDKIPRTSQNALEWDNAKGSALFFRGLYILSLTAQFGLAYDAQDSSTDLGVVLRESSDFNVPSVRSSVSACYQKVIADLEQSLPLLPDYPKHPLRPSKAAAYAALARTGLFMRNYAMGLKYSDLSIKLKPELMDYNGDADLNALTAAVPIKKFNKETIFYTEMYFGFNLHSPGSALIDSNLYASYAAGDLRKTAFFRANGGYFAFKGSYAASAVIHFSGLTTAEQYLTRAECNAFLGDVPLAMADLNLLSRKRWRSSVPFVPFAAADKSAALSLIRQERRKEMLMRGTRWADIKRQNKEGANIVPKRIVDGVLIQLPVNSRYYALPIPADIVINAGIPQNN